MSNLRALAESLGWKVWSYPDITTTLEGDPLSAQGLSNVPGGFVLHSPLNQVFRDGQPRLSLSLNLRPTEADAWNDLPKTEAEIRAYSGR